LALYHYFIQQLSKRVQRATIFQGGVVLGAYALVKKLSEQDLRCSRTFVVEIMWWFS
jgi:hypothetical protein